MWGHHAPAGSMISSSRSLESSFLVWARTWWGMRRWGWVTGVKDLSSCSLTWTPFSLPMPVKRSLYFSLITSERVGLLTLLAEILSTLRQSHIVEECSITAAGYQEASRRLALIVSDRSCKFSSDSKGLITAKCVDFVGGWLKLNICMAGSL